MANDFINIHNNKNNGYIYAKIAIICVYLYYDCGFKSNKRSHSGDDGDEDPPVPIPREQSVALPSPSKGNGRRQKLSSSTAKVVKKNGQRGEARNVIDHMSLVVPNGKNKRKIGAFAIPGTIWRLMSLRNQIVVF